MKKYRIIESVAVSEDGKTRYIVQEFACRKCFLWRQKCDWETICYLGLFPYIFNTKEDAIEFARKYKKENKITYI